MYEGTIAMSVASSPSVAPSATRHRAQVILLSSELSSSSPTNGERTTQGGETWWPEESDAPTTFTSPELIAPPPPQPAAEQKAFALALTLPSEAASVSPPLESKTSPQKTTELLTLFCICHVCVGFSMGAVSPAMETISSHFHLSDAWRGLLGAAALAGNIFGSPIGGAIADLQGRRVCLLAAWAVFVLATGAQCLAANILQLCLARLCLGWSVGAHYSGTTAYLAEILAASEDESKMKHHVTSRIDATGFWLSMVEAHFFIGNFLSLGAGWAFELTIANQNVRWRITMGCCAVPVIAGLLWFYLRAPESPAWIKTRKTTHAETQTALRSQMPADQRSVFLTNTEQATSQMSSHCTSLSQVSLSPPAKTPLGLTSSIFFVSVFWGTLIVPTYAVSAFAVFIIHRLELNIDPFQLNVYLGLAAASGVFVGVALIDRLGRKGLLLMSQWGVAAAFALLALLITAFLAFEVLNGAGSPLALVYPAEIFPSRLRGFASGISAMNSRILAVISIFLMSLSLSRLGVAWTLASLAALSSVGAIITHLMAPAEHKLTASEEGIVLSPDAEP